MKPKVWASPAVVDGAISRLVEEGDWVFVETWGPNGWERDGGTTVASVLKGATASPATLRAFGIPPEEDGE